MAMHASDNPFPCAVIDLPKVWSRARGAGREIMPSVHTLPAAEKALSPAGDASPQSVPTPPAAMKSLSPAKPADAPPQPHPPQPHVTGIVGDAQPKLKTPSALRQPGDCSYWLRCRRALEEFADNSGFGLHDYLCADGDACFCNCCRAARGEASVWK